MSKQLLDGLDLSSQLLLQYAAQHENVPLQVALSPPLSVNPFDSAQALQDRGLVEATEMPAVFALSPMGYALRDEILASWPDYHAAMKAALVAHLVDNTDLIEGSALWEAFQAVDRADFVPAPVRCLADLDIPAPTGVDQMTTSAPHALVAILDAVRPQPGERMLVCGAKAGMVLALGATMVGEAGGGAAIDWDVATVAVVRASLRRYPELAARCDVLHRPDVTLGHEDGGPWQVVVMNGSVPKIPVPILEQLDPDGGRLLFFFQSPLDPGQSCYVLRRNGGAVKNQELSRFVFTPIYGRYGWDRIDG